MRAWGRRTSPRLFLALEQSGGMEVRADGLRSMIQRSTQSGLKATFWLGEIVRGDLVVRGFAGAWHFKAGRGRALKSATRHVRVSSRSERARVRI